MTNRPYGVSYGELGVTSMENCYFVDPEEMCIWRCPACGGLVLEKNYTVVWPMSSGLRPSAHMPDDIRKPFEEAQRISATSPWAACMLLRVRLERLVDHLGGTGNSLFNRVESLDLAADEKPLWNAIRRVGNDAAHEGLFPYNETINLDVANVVSGFVNLLVERHIGAPANAGHLLSVLEAAQTKAKQK